jgi:hypothetical protein
MELLQEVCPIELCEFLMLWLSYPSCAIPVIVLIFVWSEHMVCVFLIAFPLFLGVVCNVLYGFLGRSRVNIFTYILMG